MSKREFLRLEPEPDFFLDFTEEVRRGVGVNLCRWTGLGICFPDNLKSSLQVDRIVNTTVLRCFIMRRGFTAIDNSRQGAPVSLLSYRIINILFSNTSCQKHFFIQMNSVCYLLACILCLESEPSKLYHQMLTDFPLGTVWDSNLHMWHFQRKPLRYCVQYLT